MAENRELIAKNEDLYNVDDKMKDKEPSSLETFGTNAKENLEIFLKRISAIMDGSSDDAWDDKVRTQINKSIDSIKEVIVKEEKAADFIKDAKPIVENMKTAEGEYVEAYEEYYAHYEAEAGISPKTKMVRGTLKEGAPEDSDDDDDYEKKEVYTEAYIAWLRADDAYRDTIPALEEQGVVWKNQVNNYFLAFNFETNEIDTSIYQPINEPIQTYEELFEENSKKYENVEYEPNVVAAAQDGEEIVEVGADEDLAEEETEEEVGTPEEEQQVQDPADPYAGWEEWYSQDDKGRDMYSQVEYYADGETIKSCHYVIKNSAGEIVEEGLETYYPNGELKTKEFDSEETIEGYKVSGGRLTYSASGKLTHEHYDRKENLSDVTEDAESVGTVYENYDMSVNEEGTTSKSWDEKTSDGNKYTGVSQENYADGSYSLSADKIEYADGSYEEGIKEDSDLHNGDVGRTVEKAYYKDSNVYMEGVKERVLPSGESSEKIATKAVVLDDHKNPVTTYYNYSRTKGDHTVNGIQAGSGVEFGSDGRYRSQVCGGSGTWYDATLNDDDTICFDKTHYNDSAGRLHIVDGHYEYDSSGQVTVETIDDYIWGEGNQYDSVRYEVHYDYSKPGKIVGTVKTIVYDSNNNVKSSSTDTFETPKIVVIN